MRALRIRVRFLTPQAFPLRKLPFPLHFDALLVAVLSAKEKRKFDPCFPDPFAPTTGRVPLAVAGTREPVYQASVALPIKEPCYSRYVFTKRPPDLDCQKAFSRKETSYFPEGTSAGKFKPWAEALSLVAAPIVQFCCVGDKAEIENLLKEVSFVGPFRRWGFGEIVDTEVTEEPSADLKTWGLFDSQGPLRELPVVDWEGKESWVKGFCAVRPPYWYPGNKKLCWMPDPFRAVVPHV